MSRNTRPYLYLRSTEPTTLTATSISRWNISKEKPFKLHGSAIVYHQPRRKLLLKNLLAIKQLRLLEPPQRGAVASAEFKQCLDYRIGYTPIGPFLNHEEFHSFLRGHVPLESCTKVYGESVTRCHTRQYRTSFSHADLFPRNTIVRDGKNVAIIDWQFAGWYPEYWEYIKAHLDFSTCLTGTPSFSAL
jgi:hypothetical protein